MDHYNRNNSNRASRMHNDDFGYEPRYRNYDDRDHNPGMRPYAGQGGSSYGGSRAWPDRDMRRYDDDRNMLERMGDRIRDKWNDWTGPDRDDHDRYYNERRDHDRRYDREDRSMFDRAGEKIRDFFRAPGDGYSSGRYRYDNDRSHDYGRTGFGNYDGTYGAYTGMHGVTGYDTRTRDNYTTDYDRHYRPRYENDMYREDDMNTRYGQRDGRYNYRAGDYGQVEIGDFRARERYNMENRPRYRDDYRR